MTVMVVYESFWRSHTGMSVKTEINATSIMKQLKTTIIYSSLILSSFSTFDRMKFTYRLQMYLRIGVLHKKVILNFLENRSSYAYECRLVEISTFSKCDTVMFLQE